MVLNFPSNGRVQRKGRKCCVWNILSFSTWRSRTQSVFHEIGRLEVSQRCVVLEIYSRPNSFSILLWEIATYGASPYPKIELCQVFDHLRVSFDWRERMYEEISSAFSRMDIEWNVPQAVPLMSTIWCKNVSLSLRRCVETIDADFLQVGDGIPMNDRHSRKSMRN